MAIGEGVSHAIYWKPYASGVINAAEPVMATDPGPSGGGTLRRTSFAVNLERSSFSPDEVRSDKQVVDFRHGSGRVTGTISGEVSPGSHFDFWNILFRDATSTAFGAAITQTTYTTLAASDTASTFTVAAGDLVAGGLRVGDTITVSGLTAGFTGNNGNYVILAITGTQRVLQVFPAPVVAMAAQSTFSIVRAGRAVSVPSTGHVNRKILIEDADLGLDQSRIFSECRLVSGKIAASADGTVKTEFGLMGRNMTVTSGAASPFLTAPAAPGSSGVTTGASGVVRINGVTLGVCSSFEVNFDMSASAPNVVGSKIVPDILTSTAKVSGSLQVYAQDTSLLSLFTAETTFEVILTVGTASLGNLNGDYVTIYLPACKLSGASMEIGDAEQLITLPFTAIKYSGPTTAGQTQTTIRLSDSLATSTLL